MIFECFGPMVHDHVVMQLRASCVTCRGHMSVQQSLLHHCQNVNISGLGKVSVFDARNWFFFTRCLYGLLRCVCWGRTHCLHFGLLCWGEHQRRQPHDFRVCVCAYMWRCLFVSVFRKWMIVYLYFCLCLCVGVCVWVYVYNLCVYVYIYIWIYACVIIDVCVCFRLYGCVLAYSCLHVSV